MKLSLFKTEFPIMLAPMAGFTDMTYRSICREHGCDFTFTEMISAKGLKYGGKSADLMETAPNERPCGIQHPVCPQDVPRLPPHLRREQG